ncbi:hypothetical protein ACFL09_01780 [Planctomycetota bacterium]
MRLTHATAGIVLLLLALGWASATADTFTNKATGEKLEGQMLGRAVVDGQHVFVAKVEGRIRRLPAETWQLTSATPRPKRVPAKGKPTWPSVEYKGRRYDGAWAEAAYGLACAQLMRWGDKFVNMYDVPPARDVQKKVGDLFLGSGTVFQVLGARRALVTIENGQSMLIDGVSTQGVVDGQRWALYLAAEGTHLYRTADGASRTVLRCVPLETPGKRLSRRDFLRALTSGVPIYSYEACPKCSGLGRMHSPKIGQIACAKCLGKGSALVTIGPTQEVKPWH